MKNLIIVTSLLFIVTASVAEEVSEIVTAETSVEKIDQDQLAADLELLKCEKLDKSLRRAIYNGKLEEVARLVSTGGANVNGCEEIGSSSTPLMTAIHSGELEIVKILVESGAEINGYELGYNPLSFAMHVEEEKIALFLAECEEIAIEGMDELALTYGYPSVAKIIKERIEYRERYMRQFKILESI